MNRNARRMCFCSRWVLGILVALCAVGGVAGCSSTDHVYKMYGGPVQPDSEVAVIDLKNARFVKINERSVSHDDYSRLKVLPGAYKIYWDCIAYAVEWMSPEVRLEAGHVYSLRCNTAKLNWGEFIKGQGHQVLLSIRDETNGRVVAGMSE